MNLITDTATQVRGGNDLQSAVPDNTEPKENDVKHLGALKLSILVAGAALIATTAAAAPTCTPACPKGQVCAWKDANGGGGQTVCKTPITIECTNDPLCGLKKGAGSSLRAR